MSTAAKSAGYFKRFNEDYGFCINSEFEKIYATSAEYSWTNAEQFKHFCQAANIPCREVLPNLFFKDDVCDGAFVTREYTYDAKILRDYFLDKIAKLPNVEIRYKSKITAIERDSDKFKIKLESGEIFETGFLFNASYASTNQLSTLAGFDTFKIKYELCEIIICDVNPELKKYGITVMDGPFFSIMPFGKTGYHSLTSVTFTPHTTSYDTLPTFPCQEKSQGYCSKTHLGNCNLCPAKPLTAFPYMANLARKYLKDEYQFTYNHSLFSMKPILVNSEIDDSRPTVIREFSKNPTYVSVLSGKINTLYDLDEVLLNE